MAATQLSTLRTAPLYKLLGPFPLTLPSFLNDLSKSQHRKVFTKAQLETLHLVILGGCYNRIPYKECVSTWDQKSTEDLGHVAFSCPRFALQPKRYLENILLWYPGRTGNDRLIMLLANKICCTDDKDPPNLIIIPTGGYKLTHMSLVK